MTINNRSPFRCIPVLTGLLSLCVFTMPHLKADEAEQKQLKEISQKISEAIDKDQDAEAVRLLSEFISIDPASPRAWYLRGVYHFNIQKFKESVSDFDQYVKLLPAAEVKLWERGISHYYAGMYKAGAEQFALYQTYHDNDVENSVWRFLCMTKTDGIEVARKEMLPIRNDPRIPLMEAYALFRGESTPEKVLEAAKAGDPAPEVLAGRMFYAQLYLALYFEALEDHEQAQKYATAAWKEHEKTQGISRYMWQVAKIHALQYDKKEQSETKPDQPAVD
ncbi:hypothetical protein [Rubinisphaera sp.]|uniref:tetratricopeptide repeat protein n=1 Tax=Rubinisphaera sp. TaxID=2024857 RepID=UPI000C0FDCD1|nr:hypothetical protein [Rubinisphaera sp.]MBV11718.1 hypothetical protein [Rubinisphaera sp.]